MLHPKLLPLLPDLRALCRRWQVRQLYLFGSAVTARFEAGRSDVDLLVLLPAAAPLEQGETLLRLWAELEEVLGGRVDLLTPDSLQNPFLKAEIERTRILIYDATRSDILV